VGRAYSRSMGEAGPYLFIGIQIAGSMVVFVIGGYLADQWLGTSPWLLLLGSGLGMAAVVATMIKAVKELDRRQKRQREGY
jgi:F0F1-type ATP synthase assembly protein I